MFSHFPFFFFLMPVVVRLGFPSSGTGILAAIFKQKEAWGYG